MSDDQVIEGQEPDPGEPRVYQPPDVQRPHAHRRRGGRRVPSADRRGDRVGEATGYGLEGR